MNPKKWPWHVLGLPLLLLAVGLVALSGLPSGRYVVKPADAYRIAPRLEVPEPYKHEIGELAFTAVYQVPASWAELIEVRLTGSGEDLAPSEVIPPGSTQEEVNELNRRLIEESKPVAAAVGLRAAGYDVEIRGEGALVHDVVEGSAAAGKLEADDVIVAVDGAPVETANELIIAVRAREVGDTIRLGVLRGGERVEVEVQTRVSPDDPSVPMVGVRITTMGFETRLPFPVDIDTDSVGGSSAGFMFALGVLDAVTEGDLARGYFVAGTGTINVDGAVGRIGSPAEKVMAAEQAGADYFLVPLENYPRAAARARSIEVVPIDTFDEAVRFLCGLRPVEPEPVVPETCR